jgi:hypothetical protein
MKLLVAGQLGSNAGTPSKAKQRRVQFAWTWLMPDDAENWSGSFVVGRRVFAAARLQER